MIDSKTNFEKKNFCEYPSAEKKTMHVKHARTIVFLFIHCVLFFKFSQTFSTSTNLFCTFTKFRKFTKGYLQSQALKSFLNIISQAQNLIDPYLSLYISLTWLFMRLLSDEENMVTPLQSSNVLQINRLCSKSHTNVLFILSMT